MRRRKAGPRSVPSPERKPGKIKPTRKVAEQKDEMTPEQIKEQGLRQLKQAAAAYILLATAVAALSTVFAPGLDLTKASRIGNVYEIFHTVIRTGFVLFGGILMLGFYKTRDKLRRESLTSLMITMIIVFGILPVTTGYYDFLYVLMPFPWSTYPLQLLYDGHFLASNVAGHFGGNGVPWLLGAYILWQIGIYTAVAIYGRRVFCSRLCGHAGAHAETFSEAFPLIGDFSKGRNHISANLKVFLITLKALIILLNFGLILAWVAILIGAKWLDPNLLRVIESVKLLAFEFILFYLLMIVQSGRGYCFYCPAGTIMAFWELLFGHNLKTNLGVCVACGTCNANCEMGINIMSKAKKGKPVQSSLCVGCGHCIDSCPTKTLQLKRAQKTQNSSQKSGNPNNTNHHGKEGYDDIL